MMDLTANVMRDDSDKVVMIDVSFNLYVRYMIHSAFPSGS